MADNRLAELAEMDRNELAGLLKDMGEGGIAPVLAGFTTQDFNKLLWAVTEPSDDDFVPPKIDQASVLQKKFKIELGQLWELGDHKLLCGDSTIKANVDLLMGGESARVCITDPPYSVNYAQPKSCTRRGSDINVYKHYVETGDPTEILKFIEAMPSDLLIFSFCDLHVFKLVEALKREWTLAKCLVWVKGNIAFSMGAAYQQKHELIYICTRNGHGFRDNVPPDETTVLEYAKPMAHTIHPTQKPIELWTKLIRNHSDMGDLIYEPFSGSGTSIVACQRYQRRCRAIELSPEFVAVAIQRWIDETGGTPKLA